MHNYTDHLKFTHRVASFEQCMTLLCRWQSEQVTRIRNEVAKFLTEVAITVVEAAMGKGK